MWTNRKSSALLVGIQSSAAIVVNIMVVSLKIENRIVI